MMNRPIIGISGSRSKEERHLFIRENYMESVLRAGGLPVLLPHFADEETARAVLGTLDGLLLAGGGDVRPSCYGEQTLPACGEPDDQRDQFELLMIRGALELGMPIFGICRGIQILTVAMGGTLYQDIESQLGIEKLRHSQEPPYGEPVHTVRFERGSLFARLTGAQEMRTNSMHHQCVREPGKRLVVEGLSEDGIVEAVRAADSEDVFAVQFHPEYLSDHSEQAARLFEHLVARAGAYGERRAAR